MSAMARSQYYCAMTLDGYIAEADDTLDWLLGYEGSYEGADAEPGGSPDESGSPYERFYEGVGALVSGSVTYEFVLDHMAAGAASGRTRASRPGSSAHETCRNPRARTSTSASSTPRSRRSTRR